MIPGTAGRLASRRGKGRRTLPLPGPDRDHDFERFYEEWFMPFVRRAHWQHNLSAEDARDIVQEAFLLALEKLDPKKNPKLWMRRVVDNLCLNFIRKSRRRNSLLKHWSSTPPCDSDSEELS